MALPCLNRPGDFIDGAFRVHAPPDAELVVSSPADLNDVTAIHPVSAAALDAAVDAARRAFPAWRRLGLPARAEHLRRYQAQLRAQREELALMLAREVGKPLWEARGEVDSMIGKVDLSLGEGMRYTEDRALPDLPGEIRWRPHGVIAVIGPFNFPGHLPNGQFVPALALGNTVVHKPSERTPSVATLIARCFQQAGLPPGVFNVVQGGGDAGAVLATHRDVDGVMFTGSVAVGRRLLAAQGDRIDRVLALELGGKNASIVLDDCDLERSARAIAFSAYVTAGQRCSATSRVLVTRGIAPALIERLTRIAQGLRVGYPLDEQVFMGPMISGAGRSRLLEALRSAERHGYHALVPGGTHEVEGHQGHYASPALHLAQDPRQVAPGYSDSELFAPALGIHVVQDLEDALALANETWSGLTAGVFTSNRDAFERAADELRVGVLHWNRATAGASGRLPFGGIRESGNHRPAGITAGTACVYPLAITLPPPQVEPLATWPGARLDP
jgi:succinylglutamic semialdehyde dehydrogenase